MKTAALSVCVLLSILVSSSVARAQSQVAPAPVPAADLLAQGFNEPNASGKLWVAQVVHSADSNGHDGSDLTIVRVRVPEPGGMWQELSRLGTRVIGLAHRRGQLAVLLQDHSAMFLWRDGQSLAPPLRGRGEIVTMAGDDGQEGDALWVIGAVPGGMAALATTQSAAAATTNRIASTAGASTRPAPATTRSADAGELPRELILFSLDRSTWVPRAVIPPDIAGANGNAPSLLVAGKQVYLAVQNGKELKISQWTEGGGWTAVAVLAPAVPSVEDFKLLWTGDRPILWVAGPTGPGLVFSGGKDDKEWKSLGELAHNADLSQSQPRAVAYASNRLRLIYGKGAKPTDKLWEQSYENFQPAGAPSEIATSTSMDNRPGWVQMVLMVVVMFIALGTMRTRRVGDVGVLEDEKLALAPLGLRFAAGLVDLLPVIVTLFIVAWRANNAADPQAAMFEPVTYVPLIIATCVYLLHTLIVELFTSRSVGKMVFGLKVVGLDGKDASKAGLAVRNLLRVIDILLAFLPCALVVFTPLRQRLGDAAGGTMVVTKNPS
jgi:uncharacterized RDD family membrane protein YckC